MNRGGEAFAVLAVALMAHGAASCAADATVAGPEAVEADTAVESEPLRIWDDLHGHWRNPYGGRLPSSWATLWIGHMFQYEAVYSGSRSETGVAPGYPARELGVAYVHDIFFHRDHYCFQNQNVDPGDDTRGPTHCTEYRVERRGDVPHRIWLKNTVAGVWYYLDRAR